VIYDDVKRDDRECGEARSSRYLSNSEPFLLSLA